MIGRQAQCRTADMILSLRFSVLNRSSPKPEIKSNCKTTESLIKRQMCNIWFVNLISFSQHERNYLKPEIRKSMITKLYQLFDFV